MHIGTRSGLVAAVVAVVAAFSPLAGAATIIVDDFSSTTLSPSYTKTTVLDQGTTRNVTFGSPSGGLVGTSTGTDGAEQNLLLRSDFSLGVNQQLRIDAAFPAGSQNQDFGIAVATTATPTAVGAGVAGDTRLNYLFAAFRSTSGQFIGSGANPAAIATASALQAGNAGTPISPVITGLFITRTATDVFALGYTNTNGDTVVGSFTVPGGNAVGIGNAIGFYSDQRATGSIGTFDNLRITDVPEPTSLALLGLGGLAALRRRRA